MATQDVKNPKQGVGRGGPLLQYKMLQGMDAPLFSVQASSTYSMLELPCSGSMLVFVQCFVFLLFCFFGVYPEERPPSASKPTCACEQRKRSLASQDSGPKRGPTLGSDTKGPDSSPQMWGSGIPLKGI